MQAGVCRVLGCDARVPPLLYEEGLCLNHFLDQALEHAGDALLTSRHTSPLEPAALECLLGEAHIAAQLMAGPDEPRDMKTRERLLDFLLCVANLHEYAARYPISGAPVN